MTSPNPEPAHLDAGVLERLESFERRLVSSNSSFAYALNIYGPEYSFATAVARFVADLRALREGAHPEPEPAEGEARAFLPSALRISSFEVNAGGKARMLMADDGYSVAYVGERTEAENHAWAELIVEAVNARLSPATQGDEGALREALNRVHSWLVCYPIATAEDMAQSFPEMEKLCAAALTRPTPPDRGDEAAFEAQIARLRDYASPEARDESIRRHPEKADYYHGKFKGLNEGLDALNRAFLAARSTSDAGGV